MQPRDSNIDFLRFLGLALIILAHVQAPSLLHEIRCFDVPMMLFCSGLTWKDRVVTDYPQYLCKRILRLLIPAYLFICMYFGMFLLLEILGKGPFGLNWNDFGYAMMFSMKSTSLSYMWIIRVFLLVAIVAPFLCKLLSLIKTTLAIIFLAVMLAIQFFAIYLTGGGITDTDIVYNILLLTGYSTVFGAGYIFSKIKANYFLPIILFTVIVLLLVGVDKYSGLTGNYLCRKLKYPPHTIYLLYGILCSGTIYILIKNFDLSRLKFTCFIGRNTLWIYFYHIIGLSIAWAITPCWYFKWLISFAFGIIVFLIQYLVITHIRPNSFTKYLVG